LKSEPSLQENESVIIGYSKMKGGIDLIKRDNVTHKPLLGFGV
jgi:hypothetical protein